MTTNLIPSYCTQNNGDCTSCSLANYGRDCENQPINRKPRPWADVFGNYVTPYELAEQYGTDPAIMANELAVNYALMYPTDPTPPRADFLTWANQIITEAAE